MAIQNIQTLVDKHGLNYLSDQHMSYYYDAALANLGQRNTEDILLEYTSFTLADIINDVFANIDSIDNIKYLKVSKDNELKYYTIRNIDINQENKHIESSVLPNNPLTKKSLDLTNINDIILYKQLEIINELFNIVLLNTLNDVNDNFNIELYIPINYVFRYICNGVNKSIFYNNAKDIYVNVFPLQLSKYENTVSFDSNNIFCISNTNSFIKTLVFDFSYYDNNINYYNKFILPYINDNNTWIVNGYETQIKAKAQDAVPLNIILAYVQKINNKFVYKYLSGLKFTNENNISLTNKTIYIKSNNKVIQCQISVPNISSNSLNENEDIEIMSLLKTSTLILLTNIYDITQNQEVLTEFNNGYITTIWTYNNDNETFEYLSIETIDGKNIALDFNTITNFDNLLKYQVQNIDQINPDNYLYRHLIFGKIYQSLKQQSNTTNNTYPVLQNIIGTNYSNNYINNMNFSLKYVNNIIGEPGKNITNLLYTGNKYFKTDKNNNYVTNSLYKYINNNKVNYYNEYVPNYNIPIFDMSEFLIKDANVINKYNILSFDSVGNVYYSYIGTSHIGNKNILRIGSSNLNINIGEETLISNVNKSKFNIQDTLSIDFNNTYINGNMYVSSDIIVDGKLKLNTAEWIVNNINNKEIITTMVVPQFRYYSYRGNNYLILNIENLENEVASIEANLRSENSNNIYGQNKENLYLNIILYVPHSTENNLPYYYKYNDLLILENLLLYLGLTQGNITIESSTNDIIKINGKAKYLVSSNNALSNSISIINTTNTSVSIDISNIQNFYLGNMLYITYIPSDNKLIINEIQSNKIKSVWKIPTNISTNN